MTSTAKSEQETPSNDPSLIDGGVKERLRILQRITDLFVAGSHSYSDEQIALFDDVLQQLADDIEVEARARPGKQDSGAGCGSQTTGDPPDEPTASRTAASA